MISEYSGDPAGQQATLSDFARTFRSTLMTRWRGFCDSICILHRPGKVIPELNLDWIQMKIEINLSVIDRLMDTELTDLMGVRDQSDSQRNYTLHCSRYRPPLCSDFGIERARQRHLTVAACSQWSDFSRLEKWQTGTWFSTWVSSWFAQSGDLLENPWIAF